MSTEQNVSSRLPAPEGYYVHLAAARAYKKNAIQFLADVLTDAVFPEGDSITVDFIGRMAMERAAEAALLSIHHSGVELMFGEDGEFKGVVT